MGRKVAVDLPALYNYDRVYIHEALVEHKYTSIGEAVHGSCR